MAPLQKRALFGLVFGILWAIAIVAVFIAKGGAGTFNEDTGFRLIIDGLWIGGLVVYLVLYATIIRKSGKFDERDKLIMDKSPRAQWIAAIFTLVAWIIALSEMYRDVGVPTIYLFIMFISVLSISMIAQSAGILIGYWREDR